MHENTPHFLGPVAGRTLLSASWRQIRAAHGVAGIPILGVLAATVAFIVFAGPGIAWAVVSLPEDHTRTIVLTISAVIGMAAATVVMTYFQGAVVSAALEQAAGRDTSMARAFAGARARSGRLLQWGLVAATVNVILSLLRDRNNLFGSIMATAGGLAWTVATYLAIPVVMAEGRAPFDAVRRSSTLMKQTWGSVLRVSVRFTLILLPAILLAVLLIFFGYIALYSGGEGFGVTCIVLGVVVLIIGFALTSCVKAYVATQLYLHASGHQTALPAELLRTAVRTA